MKPHMIQKSIIGLVCCFIILSGCSTSNEETITQSSRLDDIVEIEPTAKDSNHSEHETVIVLDHFTVQASLPSGWAVVKGPEMLARPFNGRVSFNSWGEDNFWAKEVCNENSCHYSPQRILNQIPEGGAYIALLEISGPPPVITDTNQREYKLRDLSGLWEQCDCRQGMSTVEGASFASFLKEGQSMQLEIYCTQDTSDETVAALNDLLQSWRFITLSEKGE